jgi:surface protein
MPASTGKIYLGSNLIAGGSSTSTDEWVRPSEWLPMPDMSSTEGVVLLSGVADAPADNGLMFLAAGDYQVDWGNGVVTTHAAGTTAERNLAYSEYASAPLTVEGWRQAIITITPQAGQQLTSFAMSVQHPVYNSPSPGLKLSPVSKIYDCVANLPNCSNLKIGNHVGTGYSPVRHRHLQRVNILALGDVTTFDNLFVNCSSLRSYSIPESAWNMVTACNAMFWHCTSLKTVQIGNTANVTTISSMFRRCSSLTAVPAFDTSKVTNATNLFRDCDSLAVISPLNLPLVTGTNATGMFAECRSLTKAPMITFGAITSLADMFWGCEMMTEIPNWNVSGVTTFTNTFAISSTPFWSACPIEQILWVPPTATHSVINLNLNVTALNTYFTNLATVSGRTLTITNNPGAATCDRTIATNKGWTVSG